MYRVFRYNGVPTYWPAIATIYVDYPNGSVEEYITDKNGRPKLVGGSSSGGSSFSQAITDGLNGADSPSASNPFATIADVNAVSFPYPGAGIPLSTGSGWGSSIANNSDNWNTAYGWGNHADLYSLLGHTHTFASLSSRPTTLVGYGITDAYPLTGNPSGFVTGTPWTSLGYLTSAETDLLYAALSHTHTFASLTSKPTTIAGYGISDYDSLWDTRLTTKSTTNLTEGANLYYTNARGIGTTLTGYTSGAGTISSSDTILSAIQKLNGNIGNFIPYTGATANVDLGTYALTTPCVIGGTAVGSNLIYKSTTGVGTTAGIAHQFVGGSNGGTVAMTILNSGLIGVGLIAPTASLMVRGASAASGNAFEVQNATPNTWFWVSNAGITYARGSANGNGSAGTILDILQLQRQAGSSVFSVNTHGGVECGNTTTNPTSGSIYQYRSDVGFSPSSGTARFIAMQLVPTINQTGGANGITVGLNIAPLLTAAADFRGIEISAMPNQIRLNSGVTNPSVDGAITYLTTNQRLVLNQNTTVREFVTSDATTGAAAAATGSIRVRINGTNYDLLYK